MTNPNLPRISQDYVEKRLGLECPKCDETYSEVLVTRRTLTRVVRYRRCRRCGFRFRSSEAVDTPKTKRTTGNKSSEK